MAESLEALATFDPAKSAVFIYNAATAESHGKYLFLHHALHAVCADSELGAPDEQVKGLAVGMWDGLAAEDREFWVSRARVARLMRDGTEFLLTDESTQLSKDHCGQARDALEKWKGVSMGVLAEDADAERIDKLALQRNQHDTLDSDESKPTEGLSNEAAAKVIGETSQLTEEESTVLEEPMVDSAHSESFTNSKKNELLVQTTESGDLDQFAASDKVSFEASTTIDSIDVHRSSTSSIDEVSRGIDEATVDKLEKTSRTPCLPKEAEEVTLPVVDHSIVTTKNETERGNTEKARDHCNSERSELLPNVPSFRPKSPPTPVLTPQSCEQLVRASQPGPAEPQDEAAVSTAGISSHTQPPQEVRSCSPGNSSSIPLQATQTLSTVSPLATRADDLESMIEENACAIEHEQATISLFDDEDDDDTFEPSLPVELPPPASGESAPAEVDAFKILATEKFDWADEMNEEAEREEAEFMKLYGKKVNDVTSTKDVNHSALDSKPDLNPVPSSQITSGSFTVVHGRKGGNKKKNKKFGSKQGDSKGRTKTWAEFLSEQDTEIDHFVAPPEPASQWTAEAIQQVQITATANSSDSESALSTEDPGKSLFMHHALPIICEDMDIYQADDYTIQVGLLMWKELSRAARQSWSADARGAKSSARLDSAYFYNTKARLHGKEDLYRVEIIKALAERNDGELKYLKEEYERIKQIERRARRANKQKMLREAARHIERPTPRPSGPKPSHNPRPSAS